ncbi:MAG: DUF3795 domain-containing protein [Candidatus Thorarchaeota archaeon SMTZ1-83]|nr:MAG: hypothetical protein AM324_03810 [Candidatus Thorarchaeota archaeon SMTZ1-83]
MHDPRDLTSYCGLYCPGCARFEDRTAERIRVPQIISDQYSVIGIGESPVETQIDSTGDSMDMFPFGATGFYQSCKGCKEGGGKKDCHVRSCASDRGYSTCVECIRMENCEILSGNPRALPGLREIRDKGYDNWLKTKEEMAKSGRFFDMDLD